MDAEPSIDTPQSTTDANPAPRGRSWYVTDPRSGATQLVEADAESTARWVAWSQRYGTGPRTDDEDLDYAALEVLPYAHEPPSGA